MSKPLKADVILSKVKKASRERDWVNACALLRQILHQYPNNNRAKKARQELRSSALPELRSQAQKFLSSNALAEAERHLKAAFYLSPGDLTLGQQLAQCQLEMGQAPAASDTASKLLETHPNDIKVLNIKARALRELGQPEKSRTHLLAALELSPEDPATLNNLGILERSIGNRTQAAEYYQRALNFEPDNVSLHQNMSQVIDYSSTDSHLEEMLGLLNSVDRKDPKNAPLFFALFKALDEKDRCVEAFEYLEQGNRLAASQANFDFQKHMIPFALTKAIFSAESRFESPTESDFRPIFVTGLPRSGTTLVEGILSRAQGVQACGELSVVPRAVSQLLRRIMNRPVKSLHAEDIAQLRDELLHGFGRYAVQGTRLVDKMPLNFRWIGYICAALPEARVIHISREPVPVAWSLYKHFFQGAGNDFVHRNDDISRFMLLHSNYLSFWKSFSFDQMIDVNYEDLVARPAPTTKQIALATELKWTEDWLAPERAANQVLTASADQVRKPIYTNGNEGWMRYEPQLASLQQSLKSVGLLKT
ncbi:sulfotransferase [Sulfitobacter geojensis]|uniref:tetratricopeptide repeat-containing sulfotransferase family protein n=1 Tax=Sulfitobacter geojensis TaxID=1342299 RepID=UPI003B8AE0B5